MRPYCALSAQIDDFDPVGHFAEPVLLDRGKRTVLAVPRGPANGPNRADCVENYTNRI